MNAAFFNAVRSLPYGGKLSQSQVDALNPGCDQHFVRQYEATPTAPIAKQSRTAKTFALRVVQAKGTTGLPAQLPTPLATQFVDAERALTG